MDATFALIADQRLALVGVLDELTDQQWATASLCSGWSVHDVAAHLTMPFTLGKAALVVRVLGAGGNYDKVADRFAREAAAAPPATLVAILRVNAGSRFTPPGLGPQAPLADVVVHGLDIGVPTGRRPPLTPHVADTVLDFLVSPKARRGFVTKGLTAGLAFDCTDTGWGAGAGPSVAGPAESLILALTGRQTGLDGVEGDGVAELRRRMVRR